MKQSMGKPDVNTYISYTDKAATAGSIDTTANLADDQIYLFSGSADTTVDVSDCLYCLIFSPLRYNLTAYPFYFPSPYIQPLVMHDLQTYYEHYTNATQIAAEFNIDAQHCLPTLNYGETCDVKKSPYIGKCNYDGAGIALKHLYGDLASGTAVGAHLTAFDQTPFLPATPGSSLGDTGYIYVPAACAAGTTTCKLHISFHGCVQDLASIGNQYAEDTGFNGWAEANNIIVLYPYAVSSVVPSNPNACWDWWGYTGSNYVYKNGVQMKFVKDLIDHLVAVPTGPSAVPTSAPTKEPVPTEQPTPEPTDPTLQPTEQPTSGFQCQEWTACVWDHYTGGRAVFSENYTHYACKGSLEDLGLTGYCGGAVGVTTPVTIHTTDVDYYELGGC
jgi:hypothetical protein